jgi:uncharacterized protein YigE (DUF2233 family)
VRRPLDPSRTAERNPYRLSVNPYRSAERNPYRFVAADLTRDRIRAYWKRPDGTPWGSIEALRQALPQARAITNAGIFEPDQTPTGLLVEDGKERVPLNRQKGNGNFYLMPNGVFFVTASGAAILSTDSYASRQGSPVLQASQSGPLLLANGYCRREPWTPAAICEAECA